MKLSELVKTRQVKIPGGIEITIRDLSWPDFMASLEIEDQFERGVFRLSKVITDWNIEDDEGKKLPVTEENLKKLTANIVLPLIDAAKEVFGIEKKKNSAKN